MRAIFWSAVATLVWTHLAFPLLLLARARLRPRPIAARPAEPGMSVIIAAHNEEAVIERRLANVLEQEYPRERLQLVVASDGSTDATVARICRSFPMATVVDLPRVGKTAALNAGAEAADGEILVFTDANTVFAPGALRAVVAPFADPSVGAVAGDQRYLHAGDGHGERAHWDLDRLLKRAESAAGSCISATGALYAIRRETFEPCPPAVTDDFVISTGAVARGQRLVFCEEAVAYEPVAAAGRHEYGRKVRIMTQGLNALRYRRALLDPRRHGFYAIQLLTHKLLRRLTVVPLLAVAVSAPFLARRGVVYGLTLVGELIGLLFGVIGLVGPRSLRERRLPGLAAFVLLTNAAALHALANLLLGRRVEAWSPQRSERDA